MTHQINLLPWREKKRSKAKNQLKFYGLAGMITISVMGLFIHYCVTKRHVVYRLPAQTADQTAYRKQRKQFKEQFRKTIAKAGQQSLDSLHFIGLLKDGAKTWALISQLDGLVFIVMPGDYLGKEHGRVVLIKENMIEIENITWGKQGLEKKWIVLHMRKGEHVV